MNAADILRAGKNLCQKNENCDAQSISKSYPTKCSRNGIIYGKL